MDIKNVKSKGLGTEVTGVPVDISGNDPRVRALLEKAKADGVTSISWPGSTPVQTSDQTEAEVPTQEQPVQPGILDTPIQKFGNIQQPMEPGVARAIRGDTMDSSPTTLAGLGGAVARGNPITQMGGVVADLADPIVRSLSGGKTGAGMDPSSTVLPSQQIQQYLTSLGVQNPESETEKFVQFLSGFIPIGGPSKTATGVPTAAEGAVADAKAVGGKLMTSDVFPPKGGAGQLMQTVMEKNPFLGTGSLRVAQQTDRINAVRDVLTQYGASDVTQLSNEVMTDLLQKRGADLAKWTGQKNEVIDRLSMPVQEGANAIPVPVSKTVEAIDAQIAKLKSLNTNEVAPVIAKLTDWKKAVQNQPLENIEMLRRQFGESFNDPGLAGVKGTAQKALNEIYPAVNDDMGAFIKANGNPEDFAKWKEANTELAGNIKELEVTALKNALDNGGQTPEVVQRLLFSGKPSDVQLLYKNLTKEGRAQAQAAVLAKVAENALTAGTEIVSPEKFVTQVQKLGGPIGVLFSGEDKATLDGLVRYLNSTRQASKFAANPQTGQQATIPILGISSVGGLANVLGSGAPSIESALAGIAGTVAGGSMVGAASRIYESPAVRDLLVKLSRAKETDQSATLVKRITSAILSTSGNEKNTKTPSPSDKVRAYKGAQ